MTKTKQKQKKKKPWPWAQKCPVSGNTLHEFDLFNLSKIFLAGQRRIEDLVSMKSRFTELLLHTCQCQTLWTRRRQTPKLSARLFL